MAATDIKVRIHNIVDNIHDESQKNLLVVFEDIEHNAVDEKQVEMAMHDRLSKSLCLKYGV
jgi:hypothetical protein